MWRIIPLLLLAGAASAEVVLGLDQTCSGELAVGRVCLQIESATEDMLDLRDEITKDLATAGGGFCERNVSCQVLMACDQCSVDKRIPGCAYVGDIVVLTRWEVTAHRLACVLTSIRAKRLEREVQARALRRLDRRADIGVGKPRIKTPEDPR